MKMVRKYKSIRRSINIIRKKRTVPELKNQYFN